MARLRATVTIQARGLSGTPSTGLRQRVVQRLALQQVVAAEDLARLGERAVGDQLLAVALPNRGRGLRRLERVAGHEYAGLLEALGVAEVLAHHRVAIPLRHVPP